jgi:hypothetical protein
VLVREKGLHLVLEGRLGHYQPEQEGNAFWNAKEPDSHQSLSGVTCIACQPLLKVEARMGSLSSGEK